MLASHSIELDLLTIDYLGEFKLTGYEEMHVILFGRLNRGEGFVFSVDKGGEVQVEIELREVLEEGERFQKLYPAQILRFHFRVDCTKHFASLDGSDYSIRLRENYIG